LFGVWIFVGWRKGFRVPIAPAFAIAIGVMLGPDGMGASDEKLDWIEPLSFGIPAAMIVLLALSCEGRIKVPPILLATGDASYSLYLFQPYLVEPAQKLISHFTPSPIVMIAAIPFIVAAAIAFALVSYRIIEKPSNSWLRAAFMTPSTRVVAA
jgi:exopolysaccharide production protein ExoZ